MRNANILVTGITGGCRYDNTGGTSDDKVGIMATLGFQWLEELRWPPSVRNGTSRFLKIVIAYRVTCVRVRCEVLLYRYLASYRIDHEVGLGQTVSDQVIGHQVMWCLVIIVNGFNLLKSHRDWCVLFIGAANFNAFEFLSSNFLILTP